MYSGKVLAVESTSDHFDNDFRPNMNGHRGASYRIASVDYDGVVRPFTKDIYISGELANAAAQKEVENLIQNGVEAKIVNYDELIYHSEQVRSNRAYCIQMMEKCNRTYSRSIVDHNEIINAETVLFKNQETQANYSYKGWQEVRQHVDAMELVEHQLRDSFSHIASRAADEIIRNDTEWGAWTGRLACEESPANYVEIDITGYEGPHQLQYEMSVIRENVLVDKSEMWFPVEGDNFADSVRANIAKATEEMAKEMKNAACTVTYETNGKFLLYSNDLVNENNVKHTLEEHYQNKEVAGYEAAPNTTDFYKKMNNVNDIKPFFGTMTYVNVLGDVEGNLVTFYDNREEFEKEVAYQKTRGTQNFGTILTKEQFIETYAEAVSNSGSFSVGNNLHGNYEEEVKEWMESHSASNDGKWEAFVKSHADLLESKAGGKQTLVINAYGGAGAGKTTSCLQITEELKKAGYVAEYVQEYAKDLVWEENWDMLNGTQEHQFVILQEQLRRMDRLYGKVDFIVTDSPILLNAIYNKELTAAYEKMLSDLYSQYKSFNFVVERDATKFEQEGRIHNLEESIEKDGQIEALLDKNGLYHGKYNHSTIDKVVKNAIRSHSKINDVEKLGKENPKEPEAAKDQEIPKETPESSEPEGRVRSAYKGFAYTKNSERPQIVYGDSKEDIIKLLNKWNETRKPAAQYDTCNIGKINPDTQKYENYEKVDVHTGEAIKKNIYLQIPKNLTQEEFKEAIQHFKENGAKYNPHKKGWYIKEEQKDKFEKYLPEENRGENVKTDQPEKDSIPEAAQEDIYLQIPKNLTPEEFKATIQVFKENGAKYNPQRKEWHIKADLKDKFVGYLPEEHSSENVEPIQPETEVSNDVQNVREDVGTPSAVEYINSIGVEHVVEVGLNTGERLRISGDDILKITGVEKWEDLNAGQVVEAVDQKIQEHLQLLDEMQIEPLQDDLVIGEPVTFYTPDYQTIGDGFKEICGVKEISGVLKEVSAEKYVVMEESGKTTTIQASKLYDEHQAEVMKKALADKLPSEKMDMIGQPELSAEQMDQVYKGFQAGLNTNQVALYANPSIAPWQMDVYCFGMSNGIPFDNIKVVIQNHSVKATGWEDSKRMVDKMVKAQRNLIIKDMKENKIAPERQLVKKVEKLNGLTGKMHSVNDIMQSLKGGNLPGGEAGKLMGEIGKDCNHQWKRLDKAAAAPKVNVPMR